MYNEIFITIEGGIVQDITVTDDLTGIKAVVIDFDIDGASDVKLLPNKTSARVYALDVSTIADGDADFWNEIARLK